MGGSKQQTERETQTMLPTPPTAIPMYGDCMQYSALKPSTIVLAGGRHVQVLETPRTKVDERGVEWSSGYWKR